MSAWRYEDFSSFTLREYKAYRGRNPKSGETVQVEPKRLPTSRSGKKLKEMVWKERPSGFSPEGTQDSLHIRHDLHNPRTSLSFLAFKAGSPSP